MQDHCPHICATPGRASNRVGKGKQKRWTDADPFVASNDDHSNQMLSQVHIKTSKQSSFKQTKHMETSNNSKLQMISKIAVPSFSPDLQQAGKNSLRLPLQTEAPSMMPNGSVFLFFPFSVAFKENTRRNHQRTASCN